jgi:glutathione S-transferase
MSAQANRSDGMARPPDPILYSFRRCPYAIRARLALAVSGTRYELREVDLRAKPASLVAASPKATVPVLVVADGQVVDESLSIMRWALAKCDPEGWLERDDAALIAANDGAFKQDLDGYKYADLNALDRLDHRERGLTFLGKIEARLSGDAQLGGYALGFTYAAILPFVRQFAAVNREWFDTQPLPHLRAWLQDQLESELFNSTMLRVGTWSPGNPPIFVPLAEQKGSEDSCRQS